MSHARLSSFFTTSRTQNEINEDNLPVFQAAEDTADHHPTEENSTSWIDTLYLSNWNPVSIASGTFKRVLLGSVTLLSMIGQAAGVCIQDKYGHTYNVACSAIWENSMIARINSTCDPVHFTTDCPEWMTTENQYCRGMTDGLPVCRMTFHNFISPDQCILATVRDNCMNFGTPLDMVAATGVGVGVLILMSNVACCFWKCRSKSTPQALPAALPPEQQPLLPNRA